MTSFSNCLVEYFLNIKGVSRTNCRAVEKTISFVLRIPAFNIVNAHPSYRCHCFHVAYKKRRSENTYEDDCVLNDTTGKYALKMLFDDKYCYENRLTFGTWCKGVGHICIQRQWNGCDTMDVTSLWGVIRNSTRKSHQYGNLTSKPVLLGMPVLSTYRQSRIPPNPFLLTEDLLSMRAISAGTGVHCLHMS